MSFTSIADSTLSLATTIGFAVPGWQPLAVAAATAETLIGFFFPPAQDQAVTAVYAVRDDLINAIRDEGQVILAGVWQDFSREHLSDVEASSAAYGTYYMRLQAVSGTPQETDFVGSQENSDFIALLDSDLAKQCGAESPLIGTTNFVAESVNEKNTSVHLYLLAATWYLSWCKLGLLLEWLKIQQQYLPALAAYKAEHPDWKQHLNDVPTIPQTSADLADSVYIGFMKTYLPRFVSYAGPVLSTLNTNLQAVDDAVEKRGRDFTLEQGSSGWIYRDARTGETSSPTASRDEANMGMQLQIGIATASEKSEKIQELGLTGVDKVDVTTSLKTLVEFRHAADTYGIPLDSPTAAPSSH